MTAPRSRRKSTASAPRRARRLTSTSSSKPPFDRAARSLLHHHVFSAHVFQRQPDRVNDRLVRVRFAVLDDQMLGFAALLVVHVVFVGEAVVPAAVPA